MPVNRRRRNRHGSFTERLSRDIASTSLGRSTARVVDELRVRTVPLHWTSFFGVVAAAAVAVLFVTGGLLMLLYTPSSEQVVYDGPWRPLQGVIVSRAFDSTMTLSLEVRGGLLLKQAHHWAALLLPAALIAQLLVAFFTGGFRRPRRGSWVVLFLLFVVALVGGWSGYALPDDMLSGSGLRIVQGIVLAIPLVGTWLSALLFGGQFPGSIIEHLYPVHVALVPALLVVLLIARWRLAYLNGPAQFRGPGRNEHNIVGIPLPNAAARAAGLFAIVCGLIVIIASMVTIAPVWLFGPSSPGDASAGSQPDWYTGFLDGALRLVPPGWELEWLGHTWSFALLAPLAVVTAYLATVLLYPFLEGWITRDRADHHLLDRPRNASVRTAIGVAGMTFYGVLWGAGSADIAATTFGLSLESVIGTLQILVLAGPPIAFVLTRAICQALQRRDQEIRLHGYETGRIVRLPGGEYIEMHGAVDAYTAWKLHLGPPPASAPARPDENGRLSVLERTRGAVAGLFFEDRITPAPEQDVAQTQPVSHSNTEV